MAGGGGDLNRVYTTLWLMLGLGALVNGIWVQDPALWDVLFAGLLVVEFMAIFNPAPGDTLSEHIWAFQRAGFARSFLVVSVTVWISFRFLYLGSVEEPSVMRWVLAGGLFGWLSLHFIGRGKWG